MPEDGALENDKAAAERLISLAESAEISVLSSDRLRRWL
jgi:hypothetical protein